MVLEDEVLLLVYLLVDEPDEELPYEVLPVVVGRRWFPGVDLTVVLVCVPDTLDGVLPAETLLVEVTLPLWLDPLVVDVALSAKVVFLLVELVLPMPPLRLDPPVKTRSDPVVPLVPYHLSFGLTPWWW